MHRIYAPHTSPPRIHSHPSLRSGGPHRIGRRLGLSGQRREVRAEALQTPMSQETARILVRRPSEEQADVRLQE